MKYLVILLAVIGVTGMAFASEYTGETPLYLFDYLGDQPIAYIIDYDIDGYLRNAVVDVHSNIIIFEIKDSGVLSVEIPKMHFLPNDYFPTLLINRVNEDPKEFLIKDEECFREYKFSVNQNTMIELIIDKSSDDSSIMNENVLANCQNKINNKITNKFDFNTIFVDDLEYTIIVGKQYLSKTIRSSLSNLTHDKTVFELSGMKFHFYDDRNPRLVYPGMAIMGAHTPVLLEFPDHVTEEISIKTIQTPQDVMDKQYTVMETFSRPNWPEIGIIAGVTHSNQITKLLVFEKNISPLVQLQHGIEPENISCKDDLRLIIKHNGSPACVKPETKQKLVERGWIEEILCHGCGERSFDNYKISCDNQTNPYQEYECFKDTYSNCDIATVNPEIYTIEGDPIYTTLTITPDCKIQGVADMSPGRFWGTSEIIITQCDKISRDEHTWSVINCDAHKLSEMQFNFEMQLYPQILECEKNGNTWVREKLECVVG